MALEKQLVTGRIEILPDGQIQVREDTVFLEDGVELTRTYHRRVLAPGDPLPNGLDARIQQVTDVLWTPSIVTQFQTAQKAAFASAVDAVAGVTPVVVVK